MKKWRKIAAAVLAAAMLCSSVACSSAPQKLEDSLVTNDFVSSEISVENSSAPQLSSELEEVSSAMNSSVSEKAVTESSQTESTVETSKPELVEGTVSSPSYNAPATTTPVVQEQEMRAVWVPYLSLDMTKEADKSYAAFQRKFNDIIAKAKNSGANTLVVHVRSHGDAYYPSNYYPWTHFLSGTGIRSFGLHGFCNAPGWYEVPRMV